MTKLTPAERLIRIGGVVADAITPFVASNAPMPGELDTWLQVFEVDDRTNGTSHRRDTADPRILLQIFTRYWKHFRHPSTPLQTAWAKDLLKSLNTAAHVPRELSEFDVAYHAGVAQKLLESLEAPNELLAQIEKFATPGVEETPSESGNTGTSRSGQGEPHTTAPESHEVTQSTPVTEPQPTHDAAVADASEATMMLVDLIATQQRDIEAQLIGDGHGLAHATETIGDFHITIVYRKSINFALVHNGVSPLVGIGIINANHKETLLIDSLQAALASLGNQPNNQDTLLSRHDWFSPGFEVPPGSYTVLDGPNLAWELPTGRFIDIDEATSDTLEFNISTGGNKRHLALPVRLLAYDEWNAATVPELLAAFVRPRSESITQLLSAASDILERETGDPSLNGYQSGEDRARCIAEAVYTALRHADIRYSEPPASFEHTGQKLRNHDTVVRSRFGTCIDLSLLYAAALEEAGLNPVLVLFSGHAYAGVFLSDVSAASFVVSDPDQLSNLFGGDLMLPVETTGFTAGSSWSFDDAIARAYERAAHGREVTYVLDIRAAHRRVRPLPHVTGHSGARVVETIIAAPTTRKRSIHTSTTVGRQRDVKSYPARVQRWRNDLLDLSMRNPLLKLSDSRGLQLTIPPQALGEFEDRLNSNQSIRLIPHNELAEIHLSRGLTSAQQLSEAELESVFSHENAVYAFNPRYSATGRLTALRRDAQSIKEETGANSLFLTLGSFCWKDRSGTKEGRAPLYLLPVRLTGSNSRPYEVFVEPGAEVQPNYCLIEKLRQDHGVKLDLLERPFEDDSGIDIERILVELRDTFVTQGLDFSVDARVQLAILQFSTLDLWRDINDNWKQLGASPVVEHLIERPGENFADAVIEPVPAPTDEADAYLPVAVDGSQLEAVRAATAGRTFVLEGPPGTGKSQTITNMIADGLAAGRSILFVAEKQAALGVVHDRLQRIGLDPLVLNVHGQSQTLNTVREQLKRAISEERGSNQEAFDVLRSHLREQVQDLAHYPEKLHHNGAGTSIWSQYQRCLQLESERPASPGWNAEEIDITAETLDTDETDLDALIRAVVTATRRADGRRLAPEWSLIASGAFHDDPSPGEDTRVARAGNIIDAAIRLADAAAALPDELTTAHELLEEHHVLLREWLSALPTGKALRPSQLDQSHPDPTEIAELRHEVQAFHLQWTNLMSILTPAARHADVDRLREQYRDARTAGLFKRKKLERIAHDEICALALPACAESILSDPLRFLGDIQAFHRDEQILAARIQGVVGHVPGTPSDAYMDDELTKVEADAIEYRHQRQLVRTLVDARSGVGELLERLAHIDSTRATGGVLLEEFDRYESAWQSFMKTTAATPASVRQWRADRSLRERIAEAAPVWRSHADSAASPEITRLFDLQALLERLRAIGLRQVAEQIADGRSARDLKPAVELALARVRLENALQRSGLDVFDDEIYTEAVSSYLNTSRRLKERMRSQLAAQLLTSPARHAAITPELRKEIDRRRGGSIRSLFKNHGRNILSVTPCILMSPASVAKHLPPESLHFDTVIFDEASQIRVADAIGALGRADAAVIAGDSKQMPPTAMFSTGASRSIDEDMKETLDPVLSVADQESILSEAVGSGFEQKWLSWHYRSRDESLITFSNTKYYRGKLAVFPSPPEERPGFGISANFVGGFFDRGKTRTNREEAETIVNTIRSKITHDPHASLGVITFNSEQRDLILDMLEQATDETIRAALVRDDEPLFVKNLENVQGDERDVIFFSLAFSRDPETGRLPLNFGPLNRAGGERRLNVAITRARTAVTLFTSFRSTDIDLNRTKAEGVAHLKDYLLHAEKREAAGAAQRLDDYNLYRERIALALEEAGLEVIQDVGASKFRVDLAVRASADHGWLAVTLDSPEWAARPIVADRAALPTTVLQEVMGWHGTLQVLLPVWVQDPARVIMRIRSAALALKRPDEDGGDSSSREPGPLVPQSPMLDLSQIQSDLGSQDSGNRMLSPMLTRTVEAPERPETTTSEVDYSGPYSYTEASTGLMGERDVLDQLRASTVRVQIATQLNEIIEVEGPIEANRLARTLAKRYSLSRVRQPRIVEILACTKKRPERSRKFGDFYWPDSINPESYTGYRPRFDGGVVTIDEISHREIANAAVTVLREQGEQPREELIREVAGIFGYNRLGGRIRERLEAVITWAAKSGLVTESEGRVLPPGSEAPTETPHCDS